LRVVDCAFHRPAQQATDDMATQRRAPAASSDCGWHVPSFVAQKVRHRVRPVAVPGIALHNVFLQHLGSLRHTGTRLAARALPEPRNRAPNLSDSSGTDTPGLFDTDTLVEVPQHTLFVWLRDQLPGDDCPAKLLLGWVAGGRGRRKCAALGMVVQKLAVGRVAERRISRCAQDQAMPRFIDRSGRHADHLVVLQRGCTAAQPLSQTGLHQSPRLPWARLEYRRGKVEFRHRDARPPKSIPPSAPHVDTVIGAKNVGNRVVNPRSLGP
jgi:hypothetical protein